MVGQAQCWRGDDVDRSEPRDRSLRQGTQACATGEIIAGAKVLGRAHGRCDDRIELRKPIRQFPIEKAAQLDSAEPAIEKNGIGTLGLR